MNRDGSKEDKQWHTDGFLRVLIIHHRVRYDAVLIYKRRTEIWKDADFDTLPRPGDAFSN